MAYGESKPSTGLPDLDRVLRGLIAGDNVVWQIQSVEEYRPLVEPYCSYALRSGRRLIYYRFATDEPLVADRAGLETHDLDLGRGFEPVITEIQNVIEEAGPGTYYVFDCLSDLAVNWSSDRMLGNFIMLICPYIWDHKGIAYFPLLRDFHSYQATHSVKSTVQILIDVYHQREKTYLLPRKVERRYSNTLYMLHVWEGETFSPVTDSSINTQVLGDSPWRRQDRRSHRLGFWGGAFARAQEAQDALDRGEEPPEDPRALLKRLLHMILRSEGGILDLAQNSFTLADVLEIRRRMIGTGPLGGKSVGMLLARAILAKADASWTDILERHDSFYIGADVFYTYLIQNGLWWIKQKQKDPATYLDGLEIARLQIRNGSFPDYIMEQFGELLDYFGQSPIIVRSSSLLEDSYESAFAGKATSVFCINQGSREERLDAFVAAVKEVYASGMSEQALRYRSAQGLLGQDEQMSILVQRVSGSAHGRWFFPHLAGVGLSFNPYVWSEYIDAAAGVLKLVFGLGTRATDPSGTDFNRVIALNAPERQPVRSVVEEKKRSQARMDLLDLESNEHVSLHFREVAPQCSDIPLDLFASRDEGAVRQAAEQGKKELFPWFLSFETLIKDTDFVDRMRGMLGILQKAYGHPVDIEFAATFREDRTYAINLLQCRPMIGRTEGVAVELPADLTDEDRILDARGPVVGFSREVLIDRIIYVVPSEYSDLVQKDRYAIARLIGRLTDLDATKDGHRTLLLGPGRWGTVEPFVGIPISFTDVKSACGICEIVMMREGLTPVVSMGNHMVNELVESNVLYFTLFPESDFLNRSLLEAAPSRLTDLLPDAAQWSHVVKVLDPLEWPGGTALQLNASVTEQRVVCYRTTGIMRIS